MLGGGFSENLTVTGVWGHLAFILQQPLSPKTFHIAGAQEMSLVLSI